MMRGVTAARVHVRRLLGTALAALLAAGLAGCAKSFVEHKIHADDGAAGDAFGWDVDLHGNYAIVGAELAGAGAAYLFRRDPQGGWTQAQKLTTQGVEKFGQRVTVSLNHAAVAAGSGGAYPQGVVFPYRRSGDNWFAMTPITPSAEGAAAFGAAVAVDGGRLIIGDTGDSGRGRAYVYRVHPDGQSWMLESTMAPASLAQGDRFGVSVGLSGNLAIVGAEGANGEAGAAYVYRYQGVAQGWVEERKLTAPAPQPRDFFGLRVAVWQPAGLAMVGAPLDDEAGLDAGAAYVFDESGGNWTLRRKLVASDAASGDNFGDAVGIDTFGLDHVFAVVGSPRHTGNAYQSGGAYLFENTGAEPWIQSTLTASDGDTGDRFGDGVANYYCDLIVGARGDNDRGKDAGAAYLYEPEPEPAGIDANIVLAPWPYIYVYTGCENTYRDLPVRFRVLTAPGTDGGALAYSVSVPPGHGRISRASEPDTLVYSPEPGFVGYDEFQLEVRDARGERNRAVVQVLVQAAAR